MHPGTQVRTMIEELGMAYSTPSSVAPDGMLTTVDVHGNEVIAKARGHVGESAATLWAAQSPGFCLQKMAASLNLFALLPCVAF